MSQKRYPEEFKIEAVRQIVERGHPVAEVSARLGVSQHSLYKCVSVRVKIVVAQVMRPIVVYRDAA